MPTVPVRASCVLAGFDESMGAGGAVRGASRRWAAVSLRLLGWLRVRTGFRLGSSTWTGGSCEPPDCAAGPCGAACARDSVEITVSARALTDNSAALATTPIL